MTYQAAQQLASAFSGRNTRVLLAKVAAVRPDGLVNLAVDGGVVLGAACPATYTSRGVGDRVAVLTDGQLWVVLFEVGGDSTYADPGTLPVSSRNYSLQGVPLSFGNSGILPTYGAANTTDTVQQVAWSYWNGSSNSLTSVPIGTTTIKLWVCRRPQDGGRQDYTNVQLAPHGYNALPTSAFGVLGGYAPVSASLQPGQVQVLSLPSDWVTAIKAGTIKGVAAVPPSSQEDPAAAYAQFTSITGGFAAS